MFFELLVFNLTLMMAVDHNAKTLVPIFNSYFNLATFQLETCELFLQYDSYINVYCLLIK